MNKCEYNLKNCQKTAVYQYFKTILGVKANQGTWVCESCWKQLKKPS